MKLGEYFKQNKTKGRVFIMQLDEGNAEFESPRDVPNWFLDMEFMDSNVEDDGIEIWVM